MVAANRADVAFAVQTAKGSVAASSKYRTYLTGGRQPGQIRTVERFEETNELRMTNDAYVAEIRADGAPVLYVMPKMIAALLYAVLGAKSTTGAADPYTHTITPAATLPYLTFWRWIADLIYERSADCKVTQLVIHGESGKPLTVTPTILGLTPVYKTARETTAAIETTQRFMHYDGAGALLAEGAAIASIRSFDLTINNNGQVVPGDSINPNDVAETSLQVLLRTTQLVTDAALWKRVHYGSATPADNAVGNASVLELGGSPSIDFKWTRVAAAPGPERSIQVQIPRVVAQPFDIEPETGSNPLLQDVTYEAFQPAAGASITAIVKNSISGAAF